MFRKYYKEANDDIKPNRALIDTIFENAEKASKSTARAKVYRYGTLAAAVLILAVSVYSYPQIVRFADGGKEIVDEIAQTTNDSITKENNSYEYREGTADGTAIDGETTNTKAEVQKHSREVGNVKNDIAADVKEKASSDNESDKPGQNLVAAKTENEPENTDENSDIIRGEGALEANSREDGVPENDAIMMAEYRMNAGSSGLQKAVGAVVPSNVAIWSMENYYDYLGVDICKKVSVPQDMENITSNEMYFQIENGVPVDDAVMFIFYANENRNIYLTTRKTKHEDTDAVDNMGFGETVDNAYTTETKAADIYFDIFAKGITENEWELLIKSISEIKK